MKSFIRVPFVWLLLAFVLSTAQALPPQHTVEIRSTGLFPQVLEIQPGDTVRWENRSSITHRIVNLEGAWQPITLAPNAFSSRVFNQIGTYEYFAEYGSFGSRYGVIEVLDPNPPPVNDHWEGALVMSGFGTRTVSTALATSVNEPNVICDQPVGKGVWFSFWTQHAGRVTFTTCGSDFDTVIGIYTAEGIALVPPVPTVCNDDDGIDCVGNQASVALDAETGVIYRIFVAGADGQSGSLKLTAINPNPPPVNDHCTGAIELVPGVTNIMANTYASDEGFLQSCELGLTDGIWYQFTPTKSGKVAVSTFGSSFNTVLSVYSGFCGGEMTLVPEGCNNDDGPLGNGQQASVVFDVTANTTYYILAGGYNLATGDLHIVLDENYGAPPANDQCSGAILMTPGVVYKARTQFATDTGDPNISCTDQSNQGVWYNFMSRTGGLVTISTCGSDFDTAMAIFTGDCGSLMPISELCNDNDGPACVGTNASLRFVAAPFVYYRIFVAGADWGEVGNLQIQASTPVPGTAPANDRCEGALPIVAGQTYTTEITYATSTGDPLPDCEETPMRNGVWFNYTAPASGQLTLSTEGSGFVTAIIAYTGSCTARTYIMESCGHGYERSATFFIYANQTYHILIGSDQAQVGSLKLRVEETLNESTWREMPMPFNPGSSIAQTDSNVVHLVDATNHRLLSLDTDTGNFISNIRLYGQAGGLLSFSPDKKELYVSLPNDRRIQVIALADMTTKDLIPLAVQPSSATIGMDGMFYLMASNQLTKVNPIDGNVVGSLPGTFNGPILRSNPSGTKLYVMETGLTGAPGLIDAFAIEPTGLPTYTTNYADYPAQGMDFAIAEDIDHLFAADFFSSIRAINLTNYITYNWSMDNSRTWAVAYLPGGQHVYGAGDGSIRVFDKITGSNQGTHYFIEEGFPDGNVSPQGLHVTPNGRIFYRRNGARIGIIGATNLSTNLPSEKEWIEAGTNITVAASGAFSLQASAPSYASGDVYAWSKVTGPGEVRFSAPTNLNTSATIDTPGTYTLQVSRINGTVVSRDRVFVNVRSLVQILETRVDEARQFNLLFAAPANYFVEASTNLVNWTPIAHTFDAEGRYTVQDTATNHTQRFYRIRRTE